MDVITGVLFHGVGASCAALCYTPQKKVTKWSWQTYWLAQAFVCWLALPIIGALITIPHLSTVLSEAPTSAMLKTFLLGMAYGIGGTAFGIAIRYVGFSLTYAISVGISCVLGTLLPPLVHGELANILSKNGANWIMSGIGMGMMGIALCGLAGRYKEINLEKNNTNNNSFSLAKGLPICLLSGVLSAVYGFAIDQGQPIAEAAFRHGAGNFQGNVIYIFSNSGAFISTMIYCIYLHTRQKTFGEYSASIQSPSSSSPLRFNFAMAALTGILWYSQFFFYGLGHVRMGDYKFTSWAIHMIMLVLLSTVAGLIMKEWIGSNRRMKLTLALALFVLTTAVIILTYGNYLSSVPALVKR